MATKSSFRIRILGLTFLTISLALLAVVLVQTQQLKNDQLSTLEKKANNLAESQLPILASMLWRLDFQGIDAVLSGLKSDPDFAYAEVKSVEGDVISALAADNSPQAIRKTHADITPVNKKVTFQASGLEVGELYIEFSHQNIQLKTQEALLNGLYTYCLTLVFTLLVLHFSLRYITVPLERLSVVMKKLADNQLDVEIPYVKQNDEIGQISTAVEVFKDYANDRAALLSELAESREQLEYQALYDPLTKLPNRTLVMDRLSHQISESQRDKSIASILFIDLDDFKKVNDTLGHDKGDELLIQCTGRLQEVIRAADTVGRLGGDEFIAILGNLKSPQDSKQVAEKLIHALRSPFILDGQEVTVSASIGIASYPDDATDKIGLLKNSDAAMYHAKSRGRNTYSFYNKEMNSQVERRVTIEKAMSRAIERGEFQVHYHPLIDISSRKIISTEALLRWESPELGPVYPDEFIPIAEQTSLILKLGQFVLQEALSHTAHWRAQGASDLRASVNISPRQFRDPDIISVVENSLKDSGMPASALELEITEGVLIDNDPFTNDCLEKLNALGVQLAMDDFGTGYSSLSYLRSHPFDILKVDRSFVNDITHDPGDKELVNASIAMAHALKLKVVAEGVETNEHLQLLEEMNCDYAQGFLFGKPMPAEELTEMLQLHLSV